MWLASAGGGQSGILGFDLNAGPGPGNLLIDLSAAGFEVPSGLTYDGATKLYVASFLPPHRVETNIPTGADLAALGAPAACQNHRFCDRSTGLVLTIGQGIRNPWNAIDPISGVSNQTLGTHCAGFSFTHYTGIAIAQPDASLGTAFCNPSNANSQGHGTAPVGSWLTGGGIAGGLSDLHLECCSGASNEQGCFLTGNTSSDPGLARGANLRRPNR